MLFLTPKPTVAVAAQFSVSIVALISLLSACKPLPTSAPVASESSRPVDPLPVETLRRPTESSPRPSIAPTAKPSTRSTSAGARSASEVTALLQQAEDKAVSAVNLSQSAQSKEDWNLVIDRWQRAIAVLKPLVVSGSQKAIVQQRLATYQNRLADAQQQAKANPRQIVTGGGNPNSKGIPLIAGPRSEEGKDAKTASPSPTASPNPTASPAGSPTASPSPTPTSKP